MQYHKLCVCLYGKHVGSLEQDRNQKMTFSYLKEASEPISLSMPLKEKSFDDKNCRKFFRGLLPEDPKLLDAMCQAIKCLPKDTFFILQEYGKECNGAISFCILSEVPEEQQDPLIQTHHTNNPPVNFKQSDSFGLFSGNSIKIPVCIIEDKISTKEQGMPSTHFLKMGDPSKMTNEYFCLGLAKKMGIESVNAKLYPLTKGVGLLVERFDRKLCDFYHVQSFHQEDFSQGLGYFATYKYEWEKGPTLKECFAILQKTLVPAVARLQMAKRVMFHYLTGNTQAHGKNMSLLYVVKSKPFLAPLYTALATTDDTQKMAMKIGEHDVIEAISSDDWQLFCKAVGFSFPIFKQMLTEFSGLIVERATLQRDEMKAQKVDVKEIDKVIIAIKKRVEKVNKVLQS